MYLKNFHYKNNIKYYKNNIKFCECELGINRFQGCITLKQLIYLMKGLNYF